MSRRRWPYGIPSTRQASTRCDGCAILARVPRASASWWVEEVHRIDLDEVRGALSDRAFAAEIAADELFVAALLLRRRPSLRPRDAATALRESGLALGISARELAAKIEASAKGTSISVWEDRLVARDGLALLERIRALVARHAARASRREPEAPRVQATAAPALLAECATPEPSIEPLSETALAGLLAARTAALDDVGRALSAFRLAAAQSYEELLCLAALRGIDQHGYQIEAVRRVFRQLRGRALLADEVGLGKTIEAMMVLREYQLRGMVKRALVICPAPLVAQWRGELEDKAGVAARTTDDRTARADVERFWRDAGVVVASLASARTSKNAPLVQAEPWDLVIVDEAHHVKNRSTLGWKLIDGIEARFLLLLTATPVENDLEELYALVTLLRPGQFATPADFRKQFVDRKNPTSPRNRERLKRLLGDVMIRNTRAQSGLRLPPRFVTTTVVEPTDEERALYDETRRLLRERAGDAAARRAASTLLLEAGSSPRAVAATVERMIASGGKTASLLAELASIRERARAVTDTRKTDALLSIVRAHDEHVLVFTRYRETLEHVVEALDRSRVRHHVLRGGMSAEERVESVEAFRSGGGVLVATGVGSEGQNLQFGRVLVNFDLPWNPMVIEQRIGRLHRMGQEREVLVFNLCARGTVEERVLGVLGDRLHLFELVVGEMDMVLGNLSDDRDLEERILDVYARANDEAEIDRAFDQLTEELRAARTRYDRAKAFDEALFGEDYET